MCSSHDSIGNRLSTVVIERMVAMKVLAISVAFVFSLSSGSLLAQQKDKARSGQVASGEAGYKLGCSAAAARGTRACDEIWSEKQKKEIEERRKKKEEDERRKNDGKP